jgi:hypothetical protein
MYPNPALKFGGVHRTARGVGCLIFRRDKARRLFSLRLILSLLRLRRLGPVQRRVLAHWFHDGYSVSSHTLWLLISVRGPG